MKKILLLCLIQISSFSVLGQYTPTKNSIRVGTDLMTLGGLNGIGLHYQARYAKHLASDRLLLALSLGYFQRNQRDYVALNQYQDLTIDGNKLSRVSTDLSILVDLLPAIHHALRVGGGLSYWYRSDNLAIGSSYKWSSDNGFYDLQTKRVMEKEWNMGYHLRVEYEKRLSAKLAFNMGIGWANFANSRLMSSGSSSQANVPSVFQSAQAGLGISYLFP